MSSASSFRESLKGKLQALTEIKSHQNEILSALCVSFLVYFIIKIQKERSKRKNFPPGPTGLPIVGYLPFLTKNAFLDFIELGKKYGSVFSIKLGSVKFVVINEVEAIKEALGKPEFLGRPPNDAFSLLGDDSAFFLKDNDAWKDQRRFIIQFMKDLGLGKSKIECEIQEEINLLLDILESHKGDPLDLKKPLSPSMSNNICAMVFGKRYNLNDPTRKFLDANLEIGVDNVSSTTVAAFFPWILHIPFLRNFVSLDAARQAFANIEDICEQEIKRHKQTLDEKNARDFIDSYLIEMKLRKEKYHHTSFSDATLKANVKDLFSAGSETVRTSIMWSIYIMAAFPEVQERVHREIIEVIGSERSPEYLDQKEMPYTHAVILEVQRWKTLFPLNLLRYTTEDTTVAGYDIPKGTSVIANFWAVHHDPRLWEKPDNFKPERFLQPDERSVVKSSNFMPFSLGKRACPGETMANMETFLYFTSILQKFKVAFPEGVKPTYKANFGIVYVLEPYVARFIPKTMNQVHHDTFNREEMGR